MATWERLRALWTGSAHLGVLGRLWLHEAQEPSSDMAGLVGRIHRFAAVIDAFSALAARG